MVSFTLSFLTRVIFPAQCHHCSTLLSSVEQSLCQICIASLPRPTIINSLRLKKLEKTEYSDSSNEVRCDWLHVSKEKGDIMIPVGLFFCAASEEFFFFFECRHTDFHIVSTLFSCFSYCIHKLYNLRV